MTDLEKFISILDNQKDESTTRYCRCNNYTVDNRVVTRVRIPDDSVEFIFDAQGRFLGICNEA